MRFLRGDEGVAVCISVIVVNYNTAHLLERCIGSLRVAAEGIPIQLIVVDNASRDGSADLIRTRFPDAVLIENPVNVGFGRANNQALAFSKGRFVLLLNADAFLYPDTLSKSVTHMEAQPGCGVLGALSVDEQGQGLFAGRHFPTPWKNFQLQTGLFPSPQPPEPAKRSRPDGMAVHCDWVVGCYYLVRREVIERVGLFDPRYFLYFEEVDHCRTVHEAGWSVECLLDAKVVHVGGGAAESEGALSGARQISEFQTESSLLYYRKYGGLSGVLAAALLALTTDAVLAVKWVLKRRRLSGLQVYAQSAALLCSLLLRTRVGAVPTR